MVFFLMGVMLICFIGITIATLALSFYKKGILLEKKWIFFTLSILVFIELLVSYSSLPTNYIVQRVFNIILMGALIGNIGLYIKSFNISRFVLSGISVLTLCAYLFL